MLDLQAARDAIATYIEQQKEINKLKSSITGLRSPYEPQVRLSMANYQPLADFLHMDVQEVNVIINSVLENPSELTRAALEHVMLVGKMHAGEDVNRVRTERRHAVQKYEEELAQYNAKILIVDETKARIKELNRAPKLELHAIWLPLVESIQATSEAVQHRIYMLDELHRKYFTAIARNSRFVNIGMEGVIHADFDQMRQFKTEHIRVILEQLIRCKEEDSRMCVPIGAFGPPTEEQAA